MRRPAYCRAGTFRRIVRQPRRKDKQFACDRVLCAVFISAVGSRPGRPAHYTQCFAVAFASLRSDDLEQFDRRSAIAMDHRGPTVSVLGRDDRKQLAEIGPRFDPPQLRQLDLAKHFVLDKNSPQRSSLFFNRCAAPARSEIRSPDARFQTAPPVRRSAGPTISFGHSMGPPAWLRELVRPPASHDATRP